MGIDESLRHQYVGPDVDKYYNQIHCSECGGAMRIFDFWTDSRRKELIDMVECDSCGRTEVW